MSLRPISRASTSALLILSVIPLLLTPPVASQSFTTIVSWTTVTDQLTSTQYRTLTVATSSMTGTVTRTLLDSPFTVKEASSGRCSYQPADYTASSGERLVGKLTSENPLNFYLLSKDQFSKYQSAACGQKVDAILFVPSTTSYSLDWVAPQDGTYYFVFENYGSVQNRDVKGTFTLYGVRVQPTSVTVYSTASTEVRYTTIRSISSIYSTQLPQPFPLMAENSFLVINLVMLAILVVVVFAMRRRKVRKEAGGKPTANT